MCLALLATSTNFVEVAYESHSASPCHLRRPCLIVGGRKKSDLKRYFLSIGMSAFKEVHFKNPKDIVSVDISAYIEM